MRKMLIIILAISNKFKNIKHLVKIQISNLSYGNSVKSRFGADDEELSDYALFIFQVILTTLWTKQGKNF